MFVHWIFNRLCLQTEFKTFQRQTEPCTLHSHYTMWMWCIKAYGRKREFWKINFTHWSIGCESLSKQSRPIFGIIKFGFERCFGCHVFASDFDVSDPYEWSENFINCIKCTIRWRTGCTHSEHVWLLTQSNRFNEPTKSVAPKVVLLYFNQNRLIQVSN